MTFKKVCDLDELWEGEMLGLTVGDEKVVLINVGGSVKAFEDRCVHQNVKLSQGVLEGDILTCYAHHWQYNAKDGSGINPINTQLKTFALEVREDGVFVDVSQIIKERKGALSSEG